jgi:anti-sigma-K factor RskA
MGALVARGLDAAPNEWAYQIFYIDDDQSAPIAGPTFQVDENGEALIPLSADVASFDAVAISLEPAAGSPAPTSQVILQGRLGGAAG